MGIGAKLVHCRAEEHDQWVASVSHLAFATSAAYLLTVSRDPDYDQAIRLAGSGFRDMTRLAAGDPQMYAQICQTNLAHVRRRLKWMAAMLNEFSDCLDTNPNGLNTLFTQARDARLAWEHLGEDPASPAI